MKMRYEYIVAYKVSGLTLPKDTAEITLPDYHDGSKAQCILTSQADIHLDNVDRGRAIAGVMLRRVFGTPGEGKAVDLLNAEIQEIREERKKVVGSSPVLVVRFSGDIDVKLPNKLHRDDQYAVGLDFINKAAIHADLSPVLQGICATVCLIPDKHVSLKSIASGIYALDDDKRPYYSLSFTGSGAATFAHQISEADRSFLESMLPHVNGHTKLERVIRLLTQAFDADSDELRAFLAGWTGIEILVNKAFRSYETVFVNSLRGAAPPETVIRYFDRIQSVMKDKYSLVDKFTMMAACIAPDDADNDIAQFSKLKNVRDKLLHGADISDKQLPVNELRALLAKYVRGHVMYSAV
jgi:hypothetical protein